MATSSDDEETIDDSIPNENPQTSTISSEGNGSFYEEDIVYDVRHSKEKTSVIRLKDFPNATYYYDTQTGVSSWRLEPTSSTESGDHDSSLLSSKEEDENQWI